MIKKQDEKLDSIDISITHYAILKTIVFKLIDKYINTHLKT